MNQFPTTARQLELYSKLNSAKVDYCLIGGLASRFYGRRRITKDIDLLVNDSVSNVVKIKEVLKDLRYPYLGFEDHDLKEYETIRVGGKTIIDFYSVSFGITFMDVKISNFSYEGILIPVVDKASLISMMSQTGINSEDVRILKLLDDPVANAEEINDSQ